MPESCFLCKKIKQIKRSHSKKDLLDERTDAFDVPFVQISSVIVHAGRNAAINYADDGKDEGDNELENANPVDRLLEGDPEEGVDETHDGAARANLTLNINAKWMP